ncbi:hypothetical protein RCO48_12885 [Peribacillus frigoritolerans]|nr:hypothetical protein [Peribacillus frigoritolerans]
MVQGLLITMYKSMVHPSWKSRSRRNAKQFTLPDVKGEKVQVVAIDYAGNEKTAETELAGDSAPIDNHAPAVKIKSPEALSVNNKK